MIKLRARPDVNDAFDDFILDLVTGKKTPAEAERHVRRDGLAPDEVCLRFLADARIKNSALDVEEGLNLLFHLKCFTSKFVDVLCELAIAPWHQRHEDVVSALDRIRDERTVDALYETAVMRLAYLDYDDAHSLSSKSIWALGNLRTAAAIQRLIQLTTSETPHASVRATEQLDRIARGEPPTGGASGTSA